MLAFTGAPGSFPVMENNVHIQKYFVWSTAINNLATNFVESNFGKDAEYLGIHLRHGSDWVSDYFSLSFMVQLNELRYYIKYINTRLYFYLPSKF